MEERGAGVRIFVYVMCRGLGRHKGIFMVFFLYGGEKNRFFKAHVFFMNEKRKKSFLCKKISPIFEGYLSLSLRSYLRHGIVWTRG